MTVPTIYERLRAALPTARFHPPASLQQIHNAELALEVEFPGWLRDLYLHCNGISPGDHGIYLYRLEENVDCADELVSANKFHRSLWLEFLPDCERFQPDVAWDELDPHQLLLIAGDESGEWAIHPARGMEIICYDVRNPDYREVIGKDLVEACVREERFRRSIHENLTCGRERYRDETETEPPHSDIDQLFDVIVALHKPRDITPGVRVSTGWTLRRTTLRKPDEIGELFILPIGIDDEIRIVTRDGNLPFIMRLKAWPHERDFTCIVRRLPDALVNILRAVDAVRLPYVDGQRPRPDESTLRELWRGFTEAPRWILSRWRTNFAAEMTGVFEGVDGPR